MTVAGTREVEITSPVDLCREDGRTLHPDAVGWSRRPLHRANLSGRWGRTKRWDYWAVLSPTHALSLTYADVDYIGLTDVWWVDLRTGRTGGRNRIVPGARGISLPDVPGTAPLRSSSRHQVLDLVEEPGRVGEQATRLSATWSERDGTPASLDVTVDHPRGHESLNVVIPWSDRTFQYTSKHQARPAHGVLRIGDDVVSIGGTGDDAAWGVLDVGRGRWPYRTRWNWGGGTGIATTGQVVGLQFGGKWTEGTGCTENGIIVDGRLHKLGDELVWNYDWRQPMRPWRVSDPGGRIDLRLVPRFDKHTRVEALAMGTEVHQVFGTWSGSVVTDQGMTLDIPHTLGFAEESRSRW